MSDYTGPGNYEILPFDAQNMSLNVWGGATTAGTAIKLYINTVDGRKQLNVRGGDKKDGTEIITYEITDQVNTQFILKAVV
ncbi:hypothetical protein DDE82_008313 [Stemphylium lycopersici]|uniref:Uncharacterized protein n=1 Tax=Stemphylium lycopersici TaxID=183478 RepID=A0A364N7Z8_STELY|nr:hypothetical protein TW65_07794 [Stemphylium lycopersici]RAQ99385.1 hypothetical protein DDE82_008313 [Stemphylium lycopersici]RAR13434.1 hypothetical protein DDE83_003165 [Stemphylium lycopersici]